MKNKRSYRVWYMLALVLLSVCTLYAENKSKVFHAIVAQDGTGDYVSVQEAIDKAPANRRAPWIIFVKNGSYNELVTVPKEKRFIHLIGQDKEHTIIHFSLNVGGKPEKEPAEYWNYSVHNPELPIYKKQGSVVQISAPDFYSENISYVNDFGVHFQSGPQALAMSSQADRIAFKNCIFRSFQDTWMTTKVDTFRHYVKGCWIEGAVDYFYGSGDALLEECTLYNVRSGSVIVAPCHEKSKYGYVFRNCIVDGNKLAADGKQKLGRPWHNAPKAIYINTTMRIPLAKEGWTNMGTVPAIFAEYNSVDAHGNVLDLSQRKTEYQGRGETPEVGTCRASITENEANQLIYENIIPGNDGWNPRKIMDELPSPENIQWKNGTLSWTAVNNAAGYVVVADGSLYVTEKALLKMKPAKEVVIYAVSRFGALGKPGK